MEILPPAKQANQAIYHLLEEERLLVLEGSMTVRIGNENTKSTTAATFASLPARIKCIHAKVTGESYRTSPTMSYWEGVV